MMNRSAGTFLGLGASIAALAVVALSGCSGEDETQAAVVPQAAPAPPPPPPPPAVTPIETLMASLGIDDRIVFPENKAPRNDKDRIAILNFFDAFARGDDQSLAGFLTLADRRELEALVKSDQWEQVTSDIEMIDVQTGTNKLGQTCVLAVFEVDVEDIANRYQPQLWYYESDDLDNYVFDAAPSPPGIIDRLSGDDWIVAWHNVIEEEMALANKPDEEYVVEKRTLDTSSGGGSSDSPGVSPGSPNAPTPGPPPNRRRKPPPKNPRRPPGPG